MNLKKGILTVGQETFSPDYTFEDFQRSAFYEGQSASSAIELTGSHDIAGNRFLISLIFDDQRLHMIVLGCIDEEIPRDHEMDRKVLHDEILKKHGIVPGKKYGRFTIESNYFPKENAAVILITYLEKAGKETFCVRAPKFIPALMFAGTAMLLLIPIAFTLFDGVQHWLAYVSFSLMALPFLLLGIWLSVFRITVDKDMICIRRGIGSTYCFNVADITKVVRKTNHNTTMGTVRLLSVWTGRRRWKVDPLMINSHVMDEYLRKKVPSERIVEKTRDYKKYR